MDENVILQRMFRNVNAIPLPCEQPILELMAHQQNLSNMEGNLEDVALVDHVLEVVQQVRYHDEECASILFCAQWKSTKIMNVNMDTNAGALRLMAHLKCLREPLIHKAHL